MPVNIQLLEGPVADIRVDTFTTGAGVRTQRIDVDLALVTRVELKVGVSPRVIWDAA